MKNWALNLVFAAALLLPLPVLAQDDPQPDCKNPQTQLDMTLCAGNDLADADTALNAQYKKTRAEMRKVDANFDADQRGAEAALVKAQRAWVEYRDGHCDAVGFQAHLGSMEPQLVADCQAQLTRSRTKELKELMEGQAN